MFLNFSGSFIAIWKFSEQDDTNWMILEESWWRCSHTRMDETRFEDPLKELSTSEIIDFKKLDNNDQVLTKCSA